MVQTCFHRHFLTRLPLISRQISFHFNRLPSTPNVRRLSGGKREVIVHTDTDAHKFSDEMSQIYVAFMKGLKRYAVVVKTFLILTATTQKLLWRRHHKARGPCGGLHALRLFFEVPGGRPG
ncbi:hypothetical protein C4J99_0426 [Pseudomonas synxantha]|nr:hypothetical protein C4J99_0426 [Pseudomonas synxantha]